MAQRSNKRQPVYSADALALRYLAGLVLIALGVMMFLALEMRMAGNIFSILRQVCYGLTGGLALISPVMPIWAGVLVIWSSQRKAPVRPFLFALLAFLGLCAFIVLVTRIGDEEYLALLVRKTDRSWGGVIHQGYLARIKSEINGSISLAFNGDGVGFSGGALGIILAFPLWNLVGTVLGAVIVLFLIISCVLLVFNLTPGRIRDLATGKVVLRWGRKPRDQEEQDQRQIAYQQEQERQRQMAYAQQQAYILQQQQAAAQAAQSSGRWQQQAVSAGNSRDAEEWQQHRGWTQSQAAWTGTNSAGLNQDVSEWQQQLTEQTAAAGQDGRSRIFSREQNAGDTASSHHRGSAFGRGREAEKPQRTSFIFGRKKDQDDGLSDLSVEEKKQQNASWQKTERQRSQGQIRRTVSGAEIGPIATQWNASDNDAEVQQVYAKAARKNQKSIQQEDDLARWRKPEDTASGDREAYENRNAVRPLLDEKQGKQKPETDAKTDTSHFDERNNKSNIPDPGPVKEKTGTGNRNESGKHTAASSKWMDQVITAEKKTDRDEKTNTVISGTECGEKEPAVAKKEKQPVKVPVAQEMIANPTWKPVLKGVETGTEPEEEYWEPTPYYAPPITDLKRPEISMLDTTEEDEGRSRRLEETLASFRVQARVVHVTHGPAISRFEIELAPGTKVGKVSELEKDIAYGMQATSVRIEAPIPGKSLVGVEVPNPKRATVTLREVLESQQMQNAKSILTVALGKDIAGTPVICDLAKMPHMLIAGATGSGKSVCINTIINSLLFRAGPDEVRMILIDPKVVELQCYNGIPHLLLPVVNDPHKAAAALAWAVAEMMERYDKFSERGVRNLEGYNAILEDGEKPMPRIVIIIDELADLMMVCKKDVEEYICRLTQLARAAGIHLIVATQRPSVDVITGLIKANIPSRIAFKTASYVDSRTILDRNGSEQLLGWGDMLYLPTGSFAPIRIQGCFLSDEEVNRIADHVRQANPSTYDPNILDKLEALSKGAEEIPSKDLIGGQAENASGDAELFAQAVEIAIQDGQISTSTLQRRLKVGYSRAGRLTDEMEARGIVSAKDGSKPRKCLITREEWVALQAVGSD